MTDHVIKKSISALLGVLLALWAGGIATASAVPAPTLTCDTFQDQFVKTIGKRRSFSIADLECEGLQKRNYDEFMADVAASSRSKSVSLWLAIKDAGPGIAFGWGSEISNVKIGGTTQSSGYTYPASEAGALSGLVVTYTYATKDYTFTLTKSANSLFLDAFTVSEVVGDTEAPTLSSTSPADDAGAVAVKSNISLTFSEDIQAGKGNITLHKASDDSEVSTDVSFSDDTVTLNPTTDLLDATGYYVQVAVPAIEDLSGNAYAGIDDKTTFNFTTAGGVASKPVIGEIAPGNNELVVTFTAPTDDGGAAIFNYEYTTDGGANWIPFSPQTTQSPVTISGLTNGTSYSVGLRAINSAGDGEASDLVTASPGTAAAEFENHKDEIRSIIRKQASRRLAASMRSNGRMMADGRQRLITMFQRRNATDASIEQGDGEIPFDIDGTLNADGALGEGVHVASKGAFLGQTGFVGDVNWRLSGDFDVTFDSNNGLLTVFDSRVAREQILSEDFVLGTFVGASFANSRIRDTFKGDEETWQVYGGAYFVTQLARTLFADGYASVGYGQSDLEMNNDTLDLDASYDTVSWEVGGSLTGLIELQSFEFRPNLSLAYGNSRLGEIGFKARAYGLNDDVSLDAGHVSMGRLLITPELLFPLLPDTASKLSLSPRLICEHIVSDKTSNECGWGIGAGILSSPEDTYGQLSLQVDYEDVGAVDSLGVKAGYTLSFGSGF